MLALWTALAPLLGGLGVLGPQQGTPPPAEILVVGKVFTADPIQPWADAIALRGDTILALGTVAELRAYQGPSTKILRELAGTIAPGLNDAHSHLLVAGALLADLDLASHTEPAKVLESLKAWLAAHPGNALLHGVGLSATVASLDPTFVARFEEVTAERAVLLWGASTTWCLANAGARARLGLAPGARLPRGVFWFPEHPKLPPALFAGPLLLETFAPIALGDAAELERRVTFACAQANRVGITSIQEPLPIVLVRAVRALIARGALTVRVHALTAAEGDPDPLHVVPIDPEDFAPHEIEPLPPTAPWLTFGTLELGPQEKALMKGSPELSLSTVTRLSDVRSRRTSVAMGGMSEVRRTVEAPFQMPASSLDAYTGSGVFVSVTPGALLVLADSNPGELPFPEAEILPLRTLFDRHAVVAFGTDYPLLELDPLRGVFAAVARSGSVVPSLRTRRRRPDLETPQVRVFGADERILLIEALRAATLGSARAEGTDGVKGLLGPGKVADLVFYETNLLESEPRQLLAPQLRATIVGGRIVFGH